MGVIVLCDGKMRAIMHGAVREEAEIRALSKEAKIHLGHALKRPMQTWRVAADLLREHANEEGLKLLDRLDTEVQFSVLDLGRMGL